MILNVLIGPIPALLFHDITGTLAETQLRFLPGSKDTRLKRKVEVLEIALAKNLFKTLHNGWNATMKKVYMESPVVTEIMTATKVVNKLGVNVINVGRADNILSQVEVSSAHTKIFKLVGINI